MRAIGPTTVTSPTGQPSDGVCPVPGIRPGVGFSPATPQKCAGTRMDPPPSLATPPAEHIAAIAAASPPLDPPGVRATSHGLLVRPVMALSVSYRMSISGVLVRPITIAPAARKRATTVASREAGVNGRSTAPTRVARPAISKLSFTVTGTPRSNPRVPPASNARAVARASSASTVTNALIDGLRFSIRRRCASTSSSGEISPSRTIEAIREREDR
ncbi:MAG: hypothetical protein NTW28_21445 [Candidatus Solibacter sp.]|nr:hypothetical protein [Candidatus Solibacter sp.]